MRRVMALVASAFLSFGLIGAPGVLGADAPWATDNRADAPVVAFPFALGPYTIRLDNTGAGLEPGEPQTCGGSSHTMWLAFQGTSPGTLLVEDAGSSAHVRVASYRPSATGAGGLTTGYCGGGTWVSTSISSGVITYIQVTDDGSGPGLMELRVSALPRPVNDPLSSAVALGPAGTDTVDTRAATFQNWSIAGGTVFEKYDHCGGSGRTVWYTLVAPAAGDTSVTVDTSQTAAGNALMDPVLSVYRAPSTTAAWQDLAYVDCSDTSSITVSVAAGDILYVQVSDVNQNVPTDTRGGILRIASAFTSRLDTTPPDLYGVPSDIVAESPDGAPVLVSYTLPTAVDAVSGPVPVSCTPTSGSLFALGSTTVTCSASDGAGNTVTQTFTVTVTAPSVDTLPPVFDRVPQPLWIMTADPLGTTARYTLPTATDAVSGPAPVDCSPAPGAHVPVGLTHVTCTSTDAAGNTSSTGFDLMVVLRPRIDVPGSVPITGYDITDALPSGTGCWTHTYTGTITDTGRTIDGGAECSALGGHVVDYADGTGTLADGLDSTATDDNEWFSLRVADDGHPLDPRITLHLDGSYYISRITLYGGELSWNVTPGALDAMTVQVGTTSVAFATTATGPLGPTGTPVNDTVDLSGTALAAIRTDEVVLRGFGVPGAWPDFSIAEIVVEGSTTHDGTPPTISFDGLAASYPVDGAISASVTATDAVDPAVEPACSLRDEAGTILGSSCTLALDAWQLGLGVFTLSASATDVAGNTAEDARRFEVVATYPAMEDLVSRWASKAGTANQLTSILEAAASLEAKGNLQGEKGKLADFRSAVRAQSGKALTTEAAARLVAFSYGL